MSPSGRLGCGFKWACRNPSPREPCDVIVPRGALFRGEPAESARISGTGRPIPRLPARHPTTRGTVCEPLACTAVPVRGEKKKKQQEKKRKKEILACSCATRVWLGSLAVLPAFELDQTKPRKKEWLAVAGHVGTCVASTLANKERNENSK